QFYEKNENDWEISDINDTLSQITRMVNNNEESEENVKKDKPSGPKADQDKIYNKFRTFLIDNMKGERDEKETFVSFSGLQQEIEESEIQIKLVNILNILNNESSGLSYYRNLINFHISSLNNEKMVKEKLRNIINKKEKRAKIKKIAKRFYTIAKSCAKDR
ncbi:17719_t:CDS:2, partial [Funneliformis geosporum]